MLNRKQAPLLCAKRRAVVCFGQVGSGRLVQRGAARCASTRSRPGGQQPPVSARPFGCWNVLHHRPACPQQSTPRRQPPLPPRSHPPRTGVVQAPKRVLGASLSKPSYPSPAGQATACRHPACSCSVTCCDCSQLTGCDAVKGARGRAYTHPVHFQQHAKSRAPVVARWRDVGLVAATTTCTYCTVVEQSSDKVSNSVGRTALAAWWCVLFYHLYHLLKYRPSSSLRISPLWAAATS